MRFPASASANACGRWVRTAEGDRTSTDAMTLPRITRCRLRLADSTSGSSGIRIYTKLHKLHNLHNYLRRLTTGHYRAACDCVGRVGCVGSFQQSRHPSISVNPASGLTRRAIVGFLIGIVDCFDACAAARARLAPVPVHAEQLNRLARWQLRSKTGPVLLQRGSKYAPDGGVQPGHLVAGETRGRRKRRQLSFPQDLIRESVPDAHDMALLGDRAFQLSRFRLDGAGQHIGGELLTERIPP